MSGNADSGGPAPFTPIVLKIGGSLVESGRVREVLRIASEATRPLVIVPGGGAFADAIRASQAQLGFSDAAAHRMALLAMHQSALLMCDLEPRFTPAETVDDFRSALGKERIPVWLPLRLCENEPSIAEDWSITSDGLAAWLAARLRAGELLLIKSRTVPAGATAADLASAGIIDRAFAGIVARSGISWRVLGPDQFGELARMCGAAGMVPRSGIKAPTP